MNTVEEIIGYIEENDVKFVKLSFCDLYGRLKNVSLNASQFADACANGVAVDASSVGLPIGEDLLLFPEPETVTTMPWRPSAGAVLNVMCRICETNGKPFESDGATVLKEAEKTFVETGYAASFMTESEFYITKLDDNGEPTLTPVDHAGYLDVAPFDRCENLRREIVFTLENMGMRPQSSHHERGNGQNAVIFRADTAFRSAVNTIQFRSAVRNIAYSNGRYATFAPSPIENSVGSNFRIVVELTKQGKAASKADAERFARGVLSRLPEIAVFTNPVRNSYLRLLYKTTPCRLRLGGEKAAVRICHDGKIEIASADTACNPFVVLALILKAGGEALAGKSEPTAEHTVLPPSLSDAVEIARASAFVAESLPRFFLSVYFEQKSREANDLQRDDIIRSGL